MITTKRLTCLLCSSLLLIPALILTSPAAGETIDLVHEFDGNSPSGTTSFGTIDLTQNGTSVDVQVMANIANLAGGDIHELYFNLPDTVNIGTLFLINSAGVSNQPINAFTLLGANPSVVGGAGAAFDTGISFGNGGGPPGNGTLTTATFSLSATGGLLVSDLLSETSMPNNPPENPPKVFAAVHFQGTGIFGATSETVGGGAVPEPGSLVLLGLGGLVIVHRRSRRS